MQQVLLKSKDQNQLEMSLKILSHAANQENKYFLAYPDPNSLPESNSFDAYFKVSDYLLRSKDTPGNLDYILFFDKNSRIDTRYLKKNGKAIINSSREKRYNFIDATSTPQQNVYFVMLGGLTKLSRILNKESVKKAILEITKSEEKLNFFEEGYKKAK